MSSSTKKSRPKLKKAAATEKVVEDSKDRTMKVITKPSGHVPEAKVESRHGVGVVIRMGRGFSPRELTESNLSVNQAIDWGVQVDIRRRSTISPNVEALRKWYTPPQPKTPTPHPVPEKRHSKPTKRASKSQARKKKAAS